jgi:hypothetical protein
LSDLAFFRLDFLINWSGPTLRLPKPVEPPARVRLKTKTATFGGDPESFELSDLPNKSLLEIDSDSGSLLIDVDRSGFCRCSDLPRPVSLLAKMVGGGSEKRANLLRLR